MNRDLLNINAFIIFAILSFLLFNILYFVIPLSLWSTTIGKKCFGIFLRSEMGEKLTFKMAVVRTLLQPLSTIFFGLGYRSVLNDPRKQAWHDKKAHTVVLYTKKKSYIWQIVLAIMGFLLFLIQYLRSVFPG